MKNKDKENLKNFHAYDNSIVFSLFFGYEEEESNEAQH